MAIARQLVSLGRAARADAKIGVRQPLPRAIALAGPARTCAPTSCTRSPTSSTSSSFEVVATLEGLLSYHVVPNFRALGPRLGKLLPRVKELLAKIDGAEVQHAFDTEGRYVLDVDGQRVELEPSDVEIRAEQHEELALAQDGRYAVALDLTLDDDLRAEGAARELSRAINDLRKANGFEISDRIVLRYSRDRLPRRRHGAVPRLDRGRGARDHVRTVRRAGARRCGPRRDRRRGDLGSS